MALSAKQFVINCDSKDAQKDTKRSEQLNALADQLEKEIDQRLNEGDHRHYVEGDIHEEVKEIIRRRYMAVGWGDVQFSKIVDPDRTIIYLETKWWWMFTFLKRWAIS